MDMKTCNNLENLKAELKHHKKMLDVAYQTERYSTITEEAEKIVKLSYAISFLQANCE